MVWDRIPLLIPTAGRALSGRREVSKRLKLQQTQAAFDAHGAMETLLTGNFGLLLGFSPESPNLALKMASHSSIQLQAQD